MLLNLLTFGKRVAPLAASAVIASLVLGLLTSCTAYAGKKSLHQQCSHNAYRVKTAPGQGLTQGILVSVVISLRHGEASCRVHVNVILAVQRHHGGSWRTTREIRGNPTKAQHVGAALKKGHPLEFFWFWKNWCGGNGRFRWRVRVAGHRSRHIVSQMPVCVDRNLPSTLTSRG